MYVLLLILSLGYGQKSIIFQEFSSEKSCEIASQEIKSSNINDDVSKLVCLKK